MKNVCVILSLITTALAFGCKRCLYVITDNEDVNEILASHIRKDHSPIYTADCDDNASAIPSRSYPDHMACWTVKLHAIFTREGENFNLDIYLRSRGEKDKLPTGCNNNIGILEDEIRQFMGDIVGLGNLEDLTGTICVCEEDNCNIQQISDLIPDESPPQALALDCKQCMYIRTDNEDVNEFLDSQMSGAMSGGPVSYTADCKDNASDIASSTCPTDMGCTAMKIKALYATSDGNVKMGMYMRMCGGKGYLPTGCNNIEIYEDKIREFMGARVANLVDLTGAVCVCEEENCNSQQSTDMCMPQCQNGFYGLAINECCHSECSGGCSGPGSANCTLCRNFMNEGNCVANCPPEEIYNPDTYGFEDNPDFKYYYGRTCVSHCPDGLFVYHGACVSSCPPRYTSNDKRQCVM